MFNQTGYSEIILRFNCKGKDFNATADNHGRCLHKGVGPYPYSPYSWSARFLELWKSYLRHDVFLNVPVAICITGENALFSNNCSRRHHVGCSKTMLLFTVGI